MRKAKKYSVLFSVIFLLSLFRQYATGQVELRFHHVTTNDGLSQGSVNCIVQDHRGFMWFGTQDGLNRYDGNGITVFKNNPVDSNSLAANDINCLYESEDGTLWIGTDGGLSTLNLYTGKFSNYLNINSHIPRIPIYMPFMKTSRYNIGWV